MSHDLPDEPYAPDAAHWLNDPRVFVFGGQYHLFHLLGAREVSDQADDAERARRWMGHAVSRDLISWERQPDPVAVGTEGEWDDWAVCTSGYIEHEDTIHTLYTGLSTREGGRVQRLGLAWLEGSGTERARWIKYEGNPVLEADARWYETEVGATPGHEHVAWRDPHILRHGDDGAYYAFITARANEGPGGERGCIALARSVDLVRWRRCRLRTGRTGRSTTRSHRSSATRGSGS